MFKVLEFSKENRRILVSHTSTFRDEEIKNKKQEKSHRKVRKRFNKLKKNLP